MGHKIFLSVGWLDGFDTLLHFIASHDTCSTPRYLRPGAAERTGVAIYYDMDNTHYIFAYTLLP
jgi:hypothetical protein